MYSVLLVDDCPSDITGLIENIRWNELGCMVSATASNGAEGIEMATRLNPDIIITDVSMPVMDGIQMVKKIRSTLPDVSIIFISCFDEFKYIKGAMDENATAYVLKPIELDELTNAVIKVTSKLDKTLKYRNYMRRHIGTLTENFLSDLLLSNDYDAQYASLLNIQCNEKFRIALFHFDTSSKDLTEIYSSISQVKQKLLDLCDPSKTYVLEFGVNSLVIMSNEDTVSEDKFISLLSTAKSLAQSIEVSMSVSYELMPCELGKISEVFQRLSSPDKPKANDMDMAELYKALSVALFSQDISELNVLTDKLYPPGYNEDINRSKNTSVRIVTATSLILSERKLSFYNIFDDDFIVWNKLFNYKSIVNIKQWITNLLSAVREYLINENTKTDKHEAIVTQIKEFIDRNFPSPTIIEEVAEHVHLSAKHANSIFKSATGETLFGYTVGKRINYAKTLMQDMSLSVSDIAQAVGYANSAYFATAFKNNTGFSPTQYRNNFVN